MTLELIMLLGLTILPIFYKLNLWLHLFEKKNFLSPWSKKKLFSFWFPIELLLFVLSLSLSFDKNLEIIFFPIVFYFLCFYNIFVLWKIFRKRLEKTTNSQYIYIWIVLYFIEISCIIYFLQNKFLYSYILLIFLLNQIIFMYLFFYSKLLKTNKKKL